MLETDEVDIDYFTPAGSTSLASLFGKSSAIDETKDNTSLKYVPPPPPEKAKPEEVKPTQWIFTCVVHGYEWLNSKYMSKGKLGLAILKIVKTNSHSIILYDSNKATLSYVTISPKLKVHLRDVSTISYYDNNQKYWSIQISNNDISNILRLLKELQVIVEPESLQETDKEQSGSNKEHNKHDVALKDKSIQEIDKEQPGKIKVHNKGNVALKDYKDEEEHDVDTDFYMNQKTKDSILKRMANMGHSVLPLHGISVGHLSDSSGSNEIDDNKINIRHKPPKIAPKRCTDISTLENKDNIFHSRKHTMKINMDGPALLPLKSNATTSSRGDMNIFISEQKVSNSELRINVNRVADKIDAVLERLNDVINVDKNNSFSNFQNDIIQKLIKEYESKIKNYENVMSSKGIDFHSIHIKTYLSEDNSSSCRDAMINIKEMDELKKESRAKDDIIDSLEKEIKVLNEKNEKKNDDNEEKINKLEMEIEMLNKNLSLKNKEIDEIRITSDCINVCNHDNCGIKDKVKKIMNDTFEAISVNFDDKVTYSGETIKNIIAKVIKKTTIQALQEL